MHMIAQGNANIFLYVALSVRQNQYVNKNESSLMEYRKHNNIFYNQIYHIFRWISTVLVWYLYT
jgi:hypothetical protein